MECLLVVGGEIFVMARCTGSLVRLGSSDKIYGSHMIQT